MVSGRISFVWRCRLNLWKISVKRMPRFHSRVCRLPKTQFMRLESRPSILNQFWKSLLELLIIQTRKYVLASWLADSPGAWRSNEPCSWATSLAWANAFTTPWTIKTYCCMFFISVIMWHWWQKRKDLEEQIEKAPKEPVCPTHYLRSQKPSPDAIVQAGSAPGIIAGVCVFAYVQSGCSTGNWSTWSSRPHWYLVPTSIWLA